MDKLTAEETISIVDLRQPMNIEAFPQMIPAPFASLRLKSATERFPGIATSHSTVRDPTKRPAPVWCCCCEPKESPGFVRLKAGSTPGSQKFPFRYRKPRQKTRCPLREGLLITLNVCRVALNAWYSRWQSNVMVRGLRLGNALCCEPSASPPYGKPTPRRASRSRGWRSRRRSCRPPCSRPWPAHDRRHRGKRERARCPAGVHGPDSATLSGP
jgi:hypothetical protein